MPTRFSVPERMMGKACVQRLPCFSGFKFEVCSVRALRPTTTVGWRIYEWTVTSSKYSSKGFTEPLIADTSGPEVI